MIRRGIALFALVLALSGATRTHAIALDSQYVLQRYAMQLLATPTPKVVVFDYTISQAGPQNIEERHVLYRSGPNVRDETYTVNGASLHPHRVRIEERPDLYALDRIAPRPDEYQMLFLKTVKDGSHLDYVYETSPLVHSGAFAVDRLTIDGLSFLPRTVRFHIAEGGVSAVGTIAYAKAEKYWVPVNVLVHAKIAGKVAREQITWSDYRFPPRLPASTFLSPKALPAVTDSSP